MWLVTVISIDMVLPFLLGPEQQVCAATGLLKLTGARQAAAEPIG